VIEVGSGGGASTCAFAPYVHHIHCFELEEHPKNVARARLGYFGYDNVTFENGLFDRSSSIYSHDQAFDMVLLIAVLEHVHFRELREILLAAIDLLKPGGLIVIGETPNRLAFRDTHTSRINFFCALPPEIQSEYFRFSPREHFVNDVGAIVRQYGAASPQTRERLTRWGCGVSYHDFELVLGTDVHNKIVLDGWEEEITPLLQHKEDDDVLLDIFQKVGTSVNRAFARGWMYFAIKK
jgi:SAM-dependent methyltransferase